jgi:hypothetical protein
MQDKPTFTGGNKSFGAALNKTVEALWRHGLNPAGMPGWSESADGWVPPPVFAADGSALTAFDIVKASPQPESGPPTFTLHLPFVRKSNKENVGRSIPSLLLLLISRLTAGSWLVAKMVGPIATFISAPAITIEVATGDWSGYPNAHLTDETTPYNWTESRIPLWQFLTEANKTDSSVLLSTINDVKTYGQKLIGTSPQLIYTLAVAPENRLRTVPDLI